MNLSDEFKSCDAFLKFLLTWFCYLYEIVLLKMKPITNKKKPSVHEATGTVNSTGGCRHKGVKEMIGEEFLLWSKCLEVFYTAYFFYGYSVTNFRINSPHRICNMYANSVIAIQLDCRP